MSHDHVMWERAGEPFTAAERALRMEREAPVIVRPAQVRGQGCDGCSPCVGFGRVMACVS
jgi:hypothetical protein